MPHDKSLFPAAPAPVFIALPKDEGLHADPTVDIWYISCSLSGGERQFNTQVVVVTNYGQAITTHAYLTEVGADLSRREIAGYPEIGSSISEGRLGIDLANISFSGDTLGNLALHATIGNDSLDLSLVSKAPIIYANSTGLFPYHGGGTYQYSAPSLAVSGRLCVDDQLIDVEGYGWFDRQWAASEAAFGSSKGFIWMGLCLDNGDNLSLWDLVAPDGKSYCWATIVKPDATHIIAPVTLRALSEQPIVRGPWLVTIDSVDTELQVSQQPIHDETSFYSGACKLTGRVGARAVSGFGFVDVMQS